MLMMKRLDINIKGLYKLEYIMEQITMDQDARVLVQQLELRKPIRTQ